MESQENKTISDATTAHVVADSSPTRSLSPSPSPSPARDAKPSSPSVRSPAESSVLSDQSHRTSLSHGSSPRRSPTENPPGNESSKSPSPQPQPVVNRFVRDDPVAVAVAATATKLDPGIGDVEGSEGRRARQLSILKRVKRETMVRKAALGFRICGIVFCLISFAVMSADKNKGWALDSFYRYDEFRYCLSVNVVGFVYSAVQACDLAFHFSTGKYVVRHQLRYYFDFSMDQILTYLLMSASSSAATRVDDWESNWGKDKFPEMATASVGLSFVAFVAFAFSSLISGYKLFTFRSA